MRLNFLPKLVLLALTVIVMWGGSAKADDFMDAMAKAKNNLKTAVNKFDEKGMVKARGEFERILQLKQDPWLVNYYIAYADYNIALTGMQNPEKPDVEKIKKYTQSGLEALDRSIDLKDNFADAYILRMFLNFNRWNYEQDKMNDIISATQQAQAKAEELEASNPRLYLVKGIASFYTPEMFGGGVKAALPDLEKSVEAFSTRKEPGEIYPDWGNDIAYGYLALSMLKRGDDGDKEKAKVYMDKGLEVNPESGMISTYVKAEYDKAGK
jgi:tetratricopeptide (TPR) repeat protein